MQAAAKAYGIEHCKKEDDMSSAVPTAPKDVAPESNYGAVCVLRRPSWVIGGEEEQDDRDVNHARLIFDNPGKLFDFYEIDESKLGAGSFGSVRRARKKDTGSVRAIKSLRKKEEEMSKRFRQEIQIMKIMDHPNIIKLFETFEDEKRIHLVVELCHGGDLHQRYVDTGPLTEVQVAVLMQQIFRAVYFLHAHRVVHRDIKPENFLFWTKDPIEENTLKLIDFGLSSRLSPGNFLSTKLGTVCYSSPQVLGGCYDEACDLWSCGVTMFFLLCGDQCFKGKSDAEVMKKIRAGNYSFQGVGWKRVTELTKDLVRNLLRYQPQDRYTAEQALRHPYLEKAPRVPRDTVFRPAMVQKFREFCAENRLKRAVLHIIAQQLDEEDTRILRTTFTALDIHDDGVLTANELEEGLQTAIESVYRQDGRVSAREVQANLGDMQELIKEMGCHDAAMGYTEFIAATIDEKQYLQERLCWLAFSVFDRDCDGKISRAELEHILGERSSSKQNANRADTKSVSLDNTWNQLDTNRDGYIDWKEFKIMMTPKRRKFSA